jgi:hypothetical protein
MAILNCLTRLEIKDGRSADADRRPLQDAGLVLDEIVRPGRALKLSASPAGLRKVAEVLPLWEVAQKEFETTFGRGRAIRLRNDILEMARAT